MSLLFPGQIEILEMNLEQVRVLVSVACSEVFSALSSREPRSAREIGELIDRSPASVSEHFTALLEVGLIVPAGTRKRRSRTEALFVLTGLETRFMIAKQTPEAIAQYILRFSGQMRQADRQHEAFYSALAVDKTFADFLAYKLHTVYLDRDRALRLKIAISEIHSLAKELNETNPETRENGEFVRVQFTSLMLPTVQDSKRQKEKFKKD